MIKLLLADDHAIVREGMKQLFALTPDIIVNEEASDGNQVLELVSKKNSDVLLMDLSMPGVSGVNLITRICQMQLNIPIIVLSMHSEPQIAKRAVKAGVQGYLTKDCDPEVLLFAIRQVARGGRFLDPSLTEQIMFDNVIDPLSMLEMTLSDREKSIFYLLAQGKAIKEIADILMISSKTVSTHKMRLMQKMNFDANADIVRYAVENNLLDTVP